MNKCIDSIGIIRQKQEHEARIRAFQEETGYLKGKLDFDLMSKLYGQRFESARAFMFWVETFNRTNELVTRGLRANSGGYQLKGPEDKPKKQYFEIKDNSEEWDEALDKEVFAALLKNYKEQVDAKYLPAFYQTIASKYNNNYTKYVNDLYKKSILMKGKKIYPAKKSYLKDPAVKIGLDLIESLGVIREEMGGMND
jgi:hypothetical protein